MDKKDELKYAEVAMKWYGWGSPVGLGLFLLLITVSIAIIKFVFIGI